MFKGDLRPKADYCVKNGKQFQIAFVFINNLTIHILRALEKHDDDGIERLFPFDSIYEDLSSWKIHTWYIGVLFSFLSMGRGARAGNVPIETRREQ